MLRNCFVAVALFCMLTVQWTGVISADIKSIDHEYDNVNDLSRELNTDLSPENESEEYEVEQKQHNAIDKTYGSEESVEAYIDDGTSHDMDHNWDVLIFTQQWPVTTCYHWREEDKDHPCVLPSRKEFWTIHGIWPSKAGKMGPNFCNKSADFDINQLQNIANRLQQYWPDISGETNEHNWLWKHEWLKHGTCAALLDALDNERKYFGQGLVWRDIYNISSIFDSSDIHPDSVNTVVALQTALLKVLGKNPSIHCLYDNKKDLNFLSEIRLCFDKQLELIDCNGIKLGDAVTVDHPGGNVITNCHISKPVHYPSNVPPLLRRQWRHSFVNLYKLLHFVMWATL